MKHVLKNFWYQSLFQLTKIMMPIITVPIVSKALGPSGLGIFNYTNSIAQYFVLVASLGITMYGNREIALAYNRKENISKVFWEICLLKAILTTITLLVYFLVISFLGNSSYFYIQSLTILAVMFDISWFFMGIEDFRKTSMINLAIQFITFIFIICFIKDSSDTTLYVLLQSLGAFFSQLFTWLFIRKHINFRKVLLVDSFRHIHGSFEFFIPQVAILLYTNLNKTLLGIFIGSTAVGYYTNSLTINTVFITIITTVDMVLLPHMSGLYAKGNVKKMVNIIDKTLHLQLYFSVPAMFGMLIVYDKLVPWFFGKEFLFINKVIPLFSILIVVIPLGMSISRQYLIPIGKVKTYNKSVLIGAVINILCNIILLPLIGFFGVIFSNILAEIFVTMVRTKSFLKQTTFRFKKRKIWIIFSSAIIMWLVTRMVTKDMSPTFVTNLIQVSLAVPIYFGLTTLSGYNPILNSWKELKEKK
ncbi:oligosaccharide flippase family protein [Enterococcus villorum]|uniref:Flippase n=2 Tax=Enterococcus villorum TaxID=112904 RepID=A0A511J2K9_9ENTE|nr:oligosaccharide flippase family protein [Enterococcus villorum]EOH91944.1 hypothetical protein UAO_00615 [Enterococcus villorum ATCC 700913]EOW76660.1 hypothetical protein I591_01968 [Enterococcus villorum ATCC 700913]GEL92246.1 flippase [Enterococcus villorum]